MSKTLGASLFVKDGVKYDYCFLEAVKCMQDFADKIAVVCVESEDDTYEQLMGIKNDKTTIVHLQKELWDSVSYMQKYKLSFFSNIAHAMLDTDYFFNLQADEIVHENSYDAIRKAIETNSDGYLCSRINLWKDCNHQLNVPQERKPCSTEVIRLAKQGAYSYDDAENLIAQSTYDFVDEIQIVHYGFVRKKEIMADKIRNIQANIFGMTPDSKLDGMTDFDSTKWFTDDDLISFNNHPKIMAEWVKNRP